MSAAFAATGGGLAITHGLEGMASGFRSGNSAMAAFAASQALLDLGRFKEDMKGVTSATGGATSVFSKLGGIMKAHPLMTIATVLAGAASVMAIFGSETEESADEMERLADAMKKVQLSQGAAELLGLTEGPQKYEAQIRSVAGQFDAAGMTYGQMATALGASPGSLIGLQQAAGVPFAPQRLGSYADQRRPGTQQNVRFIQGGGGETTPFMRTEDQRVTREAASAILRTLLRSMQSEAKKIEATGKAGGEPMASIGLPPMGFPLPAYSPQRVDSGVTFGPTAAEGPFVRGGVRYGESYGTGAMLMRQPGDPGTFEFQNAQAEAAKANMQELIAQGEMFGQTIGDAFFRVAEGTMTAKQALAELVRMFAQMGAQRVFRQLGGAAFGATQTQGTVDNMAVPGQGP
jgi:hypothetical protein